MEPKKNPKYDVHRQRGTIFKISLVVTLALVITAFKWSVPIEQETGSDIPLPLANNLFDDVIPSTSIRSEVAPKAREIKPRKQNSTEFVEVANNQLLNIASPAPSIDQGEPFDNSIPMGPIEIPEEINETDIFDFVEKMPEPVGGYEGFYKMLSKNIKYPKRASRDNVTGKVFVCFVVNERSELSDFKILKGIGYGCDEEAIRVIALSKWNAGKQRGRPVKVRMVQTINFQLNRY